MAKKRVLRGTTILAKFINSNGTEFPNSFLHFTHDGEMEHTCCLCQKEEHLTYLEINRGINRAYACKTCAGIIKRENHILFKRLDVSHRLSVPSSLSQYIKTGLVPSHYLAVAGWDSVGKKTNKCFFCSKQHISMVNFQAPVGQFTNVHSHVMICTTCKEHIDDNEQNLKKHLIDIPCCSCGEEYYITETELVSRIGLTREEFDDVCLNSPDSTISQYMAYLTDYKCFNCLTSNGYENVPLKIQLECNDCGDPAIFNTHHRVPPPDASNYYCDNCKNRRVSTPKSEGTRIGGNKTKSDEFSESIEMPIHKPKSTKERIQAKEIEGDFREKEYGVFSHRYLKSNIRYIIRRYKNSDFLNFYYYVIYEHVEDTLDDLPFINENLIDTPYGTLSIILSSLDAHNGDIEKFPQDAEALYKCIDEANMAALDIVKVHERVEKV